ncbi:MAG: DNA topoisomerase IV subunit A [Pseudomonadota bacterium]
MTLFPEPPETGVEPVALHEAARRRYLNYAMSVISSRALPDVRDGLKPVQRRILYAMFHNLHLMPEGRFRKSAAVVGEAMAKYHPHGDSAIYEAMVRMAQPFSLLHPLVDGHGNFGSPDGDSAAAMRYTECRLTPIAIELLAELAQRTVDFRPTYDGQLFEPIVLPARFPQLLVNGSEGIAVGMATRIPPHNLREVIDACLLLIDEPQSEVADLCRKLRGPDFPTGGLILDSRAELQRIYEEGSGPVRVQGTWEVEKRGRKTFVIITSIPYALNKASLVEKIGELVAARKVPQIQDVRDESTEVCRVVLELRNAEDADAAMAFLFKHTPLQQTYHVNLTALVPQRGTDIPVPRCLDLKSLLRDWLDFRFDTVRRRFEFELQKLRERIHILEGFEIIFVDLDEAIRIIRASEGRRDAQEQLMDRFGLDDLQADSILELKLYRLSRLEILEIRQELDEKRREAERIEAILAEDRGVWGVVRDELVALREKYGVKRKTAIGKADEAALDYRDDAYIVAEDTFVIVTRDGWIKRQSSFTEISKIRIKEGDQISWLIRASTRSALAFFTDQGSAYVMLVDDVAATTGYGNPVQKHFQLADRERVVALQSFDPRNAPPPPEGGPAPEDERPAGAPTQAGEPAADDSPPPPWAVAVTRFGRTARFPLYAHSEPSLRTGRRFMKLSGEGDGVVAVYVCDGSEHVSLASDLGRVLAFPVAEVNVLRAAGKGVMAMKLRDEDRILAFELTTEPGQGARVFTERGREVVVTPRRYGGSRGARGSVVLQRGRFVQWERAPIVIIDPAGSDPPGEE